MTNIFPDPTTQWRINYFNDIKMPLLTTHLMYNHSIDLEANMRHFVKVLELKSLTSDEVYIKNCMKKTELHEKGVALITEAIQTIVSSSE